ncbi:MAG: metallophosphoesterase [Rhizobiaceae bacterium]|nr:metallophosphoesterase [Rhizobiaceae bacterium]
MFTLAHISDIHLGPMPKVHWSDLLSKRITGYINWQRNRARNFSPSVLNKLAAHMKSAHPDHTVITGDLVNLSLPEEIERAKRWLNSLGDGNDISIVCGNHDAYINGMLEKAIIAWQEYLVGDDQTVVHNNDSFPVLRKRGPCSLILVNTALPTKPFDATGLFDQLQAERLEKLLSHQKDNCRVILIHHPPYPNATKPSQILIGEELFRDVIKKTGAELVLHGHTHRDTLNWLDGPGSPAPVVCVPAGGQAVGGLKPAAHYNWFEIEAEGIGWNITQRKFGYSKRDSGISQLDSIKLL